MATDIHLRVQRLVDGAWRFGEVMTANPYHAQRPDAEPELTPEVWYDERNYDLFAMLADVRNGRGVAGISTGEGFVPVAAARGLPGDLPVADGVTADGYWLGDHSHSWLTFRELDDYDWSQTTVKAGVLNAVQYKRWSAWAKGHGVGPPAWAGSVAGATVRNVPEDELRRLIAEVEQPFSERTARGWDKEFEAALAERLRDVYCRVSWPVMYSTAAGRFYQETMPRLKKLAAGDRDAVRIVFGFDS